MHVEESKRTSLFWHDLWCINGSTRQGIIADSMQTTRAKYQLERIMARIKKMRKNKCENSYCIDNSIGEHNTCIASLFANK